MPRRTPNPGQHNRPNRPLIRLALGCLLLALPFLPHLPSLTAPASAAQTSVPVVETVELQPLQAQAKRIADALDFLGSPLSAAEKAALQAAKTPREIQQVLDPRCLMVVSVNPEERVKVAAGPAPRTLDEDGWQSFLVKVTNEAGTTAELKVESPNSAPIFRRSTGSPRPEETLKKEDVPGRWLEAELYNSPPFRKELSGLEVEYRILQLYCGPRGLGQTFSARDHAAEVKSKKSGTRKAGDVKRAGPRASQPSTINHQPSTPFKREAKFSFNVGQGTQDLGFRSECDLLFTCRPAVAVTFRIQDDDGSPAMAALTIRDIHGRIYPYRGKRLAPDFFFQDQIYRQTGESVSLPPGTYLIDSVRGPEYVMQSQKVVVAGKPQTVSLRLKRWIDPAKAGWISGDHHIHAAGCAHYENPTQGVFPEDMWRHIQGEDLKVGCSLTWGPCYYYQKQFFTGKPDKLSTDKYVLRYDIEVSGWSSHRSGHLCLLRLKDQDYPGAKVQEEWPNLGLLVLKWAKAQGAVTGPAHSGNGLDVRTTELPNYVIPPYTGIGANEYIMQITHEVPGPDGKLVPAVDFISTVDTNPLSELNMWYHSLNAGFRVRASGETDFPCIYGERVGIGRAYVKMDDRKKVDFDRWVDGIQAGRSYVSDGKSHLIDFQVNGLEVGTKGSEVRLASPGTVRATARVAALLPDTPALPRPGQRAYVWDLEKARQQPGREVPVELVVNGYPVARQMVVADGTERTVTFEGVKLDRSSWVAMRIFPSSHTNPVFVLVGGKPIRASRKSIQWCLDGVDACYAQKQRTYKPEEQEIARAAYEHARRVYRERLAEAEGE